VRWSKRFALGGLGLIVLMLLVGVVSEWFASRSDAHRFPQEGRLVDADGLRLNIRYMGLAAPGAPTVILESGLGSPALGWKFVQPGIAAFAGVCSYDRAGYGWSDPAETPRTSLQIAKELHALLQNAGLKPPYILVGHSFGGYNIRMFNALYPEEVAGAVFVDPSHEDQEERLPPGLKKLMDDQNKSFASMAKLMPLAIPTGVARLLQGLGRKKSALPLDYTEEIEYLQRRTTFIDAVAREGAAFGQSASQVRGAGSFGDKPLIVLTACKHAELADIGPVVTEAELSAFQQIWMHDLQPRIARLSTRGKQILVPNSDHMIPEKAPRTVIDAVREVMREVASSSEEGRTRRTK
jgi:pimeloyl-ACP methyl ester carboxylesterase